MKSLVLISIICIYSLSILGIGVKGFYCCGKLASVSVTLAGEKKENSKDDCCKTTYKYFQVKDSHLASDNTIAISNAIADFHLSNHFGHAAVLIVQSVTIINGSHAPPIYEPVPLYLSNCVFRV